MPSAHPSFQYGSRGHALGFANRTRKNLLYITTAFADGADVHVITQLVNSLLGIIVFPWERDFLDTIGHITLDSLTQKGWPHWQISEGTSTTLGQLLHRLRNGTAHGQIAFSSESRYLADVTITIRNDPPQKASHHGSWCASIRADHLHDFCIRLLHLITEHAP